MTERLRELERRGVIRGYHADVDPIALGLGVRAQLRITLDGKAPQKEKDVLRRLTASPLVRSVYRVSGEDCFVADVICRRIEDVNALLLELQSTRAMQSSRTAFVLETVLDKGTLGPLPPGLAPGRAGGGAGAFERLDMSPRHRRLLPWIALGVIYVVWGSTYLAIRIAVREVPPFGAAGAALLRLRRRHGRHRLDRGPAPWVAHLAAGRRLLAGRRAAPLDRQRRS